MSSAKDFSSAGAEELPGPSGHPEVDCPLPPVGGLVWQLPGRHHKAHCSIRSSGAGTASSQPSCSDQQQEQQQPVMAWLGPLSSPALTHLQLTFNTHTWWLLDPAACTVKKGLADGLERLLKRRYYLVERARGATLVGLLVGTLGAAGYLTALEQLRALAAQVRGWRCWRHTQPAIGDTHNPGSFIRLFSEASFRKDSACQKMMWT